MVDFKKFLKSLDAFGEPVSLNYAGDSTYKTLPGALATILINFFLIVYGVTQC